MPDQPKIADVKQGLATADDLRFTRYWWEVPVDQVATSRAETFRGKKWVPFAKGGRPFYQDIALVVNWGNDGEEIRSFPKAVIRNESFYFRPGLAWARMMVSGRLDFSPVPGRCIFSHAGGGGQLFLEHAELAWAGCAALNSTLEAAAFRLMNPLAHGKESGAISRLFILPETLHSWRLGNLAREAHDLLWEWATGDETATVFVAPWIVQVWLRRQGKTDADLMPTTGHPLARDFAWSDWPSARAIRQALAEGPPTPLSLRALAEACVRWQASLQGRLAEIQAQIDDEVYRLYGISDQDRAQIEAELSAAPEAEPEEAEETEGPEAPETEAVLSAEEHIRRLVHYLAHQVLREDPDGIVPLDDTYTADGRLERGLAYRVRTKFAELFGPVPEAELQGALGMTLDEWLATRFFGYHLGLYRLRPVIWQVSSRPRGRPAFGCFIHWPRLDADTLRKIREVYLRPAVEGARQLAQRLASELARKQEAGVSGRELSQAERLWRQAEDRYEELVGLAGRIERLLEPHRLKVQSRSGWVVEKVNELVAGGYRPCRDYGVRVNIEPLKQAGVLPAEAERVRG